MGTFPLMFLSFASRSLVCSPIAASIILSLDPRSATAQSQSQASAERGGNFSVNATTQNGPLTLTFPSAPRSCNLQLRASGSLGPADVSPPKTYEGAFEVQTSMAYTQAGFGDGSGRRQQGQRMLVFESDGNTKKRGWICSSDEGRWRGDIKVTSSMAPVTLRL